MGSQDAVLSCAGANVRAGAVRAADLMGLTPLHVASSDEVEEAREGGRESESDRGRDRDKREREKGRGGLKGERERQEK
jgi:hypothetical protein